MATVFLVRHAEPQLTGVFLGQMDPPISAAGRAQAAALASLEVATVWCSPLRRALETADCITQEKIVLEDLRELHCGQWTGKRWAEIEAEWPELAERKSADWLRVTAPDAEPWADFMERIGDAWSTIRNGPSPSAIVAHQGVNSALANLIDGRDPLAFTQKYGEAIRVDYHR